MLDGEIVISSESRVLGRSRDSKYTPLWVNLFGNRRNSREKPKKSNLSLLVRPKVSYIHDPKILVPDALGNREPTHPSRQMHNQHTHEASWIRLYAYSWYRIVWWDSYISSRGSSPILYQAWDWSLRSIQFFLRVIWWIVWVFLIGVYALEYHVSWFLVAMHHAGSWYRFHWPLRSWLSSHYSTLIDRGMVLPNLRIYRFLIEVFVSDHREQRSLFRNSHSRIHYNTMWILEVSVCIFRIDEDHARVQKL